MTLVIMAAGMGSRFGGLKQIQPIDDDQNFIIDYSVYDAIKAGFDRVIFIIKEENLEIFKSTIGNRLSEIIDVEYVFQKLDDVPTGIVIPENRIKPWGTAHAMYSIRNVVSDKFAMINADDFYGYESFAIVASFLNSNSEDEFANIGYLVKNTLSDKGAVKRGVLHADENGFVERLVESSIERREDGEVYATPLNKDAWRKIEEDTLVSMNMFGFTPDYFERSRELFVEFLSEEANRENLKSEFYIPMAVNHLIGSGEATLRVLTCDAQWFGVTYKEDKPEVVARIAALIAEGEYPAKLWE